MLPDRTPLVHAAIVSALVWLVAGCATTQPRSGPAARPPRPSSAHPAPAPVVPPPARPEPPPTPSAPPAEPERIIDPAAEPVVARLAKQLRIPRDAIEVLQVTRANWPDACLGVPAEGEVCAEVVTPGFAVSVAANGARYEFRTDASGQRIRVSSAPLAEPGEPLLTWRDSQSFSVLVVGTQRVAFGRRGCPLLVAPLPVPERANELVAFLARFAPFHAWTAAGEVTLRGVGKDQPTEVEQRMMAEWARLISAEAEGGLSEPLLDRALVWKRSGGIAGFCDAVVISRTGRAAGYSCRGAADQLLNAAPLTSAEVARLYRWLDRFEAFSWNSDDGSGTPDGLLITLDLAGEGVDPVNESEREQILAFVNAIVRRLLTQPQNS